VRNDLIALADAERRFFATKARYGKLDELRDETGIFIPVRKDYKYWAEAGENSFRIYANYTGINPKGPGRISIDERMKFRE
jgi:hypothetical protein